jgi:acylphosphatase
MAIKRVNVVVEGRVQGVFFRAGTREAAIGLCLRGWVRNRPEGSVEAEIEGEEKEVRGMLAWFHQGPPGSQVRKVTETPLEPVGSEKEFVIRY